MSEIEPTCQNCVKQEVCKVFEAVNSVLLDKSVPRDIFVPIGKNCRYYRLR